MRPSPWLSYVTKGRGKGVRTVEQYYKTIIIIIVIIIIEPANHPML